jgi:peptidoglycan biosynthesis protein MviN/MurJ (putative lipid II flippase)
MGASGLSLATVISSIVNFIILILFLGENYIKINFIFVLKISLISAVFLCYLYLLKDFNLLFNIGSSVIVYYYLLRLSGIEESGELINIIKRKSMNKRSLGEKSNV